jgi:hypothetical protein
MLLESQIGVAGTLDNFVGLIRRLKPNVRHERERSSRVMVERTSAGQLLCVFMPLRTPSRFFTLIVDVELPETKLEHG